MYSERMHGGPEESLDSLSQRKGLIGLKGKQPAVWRRACSQNSHRFREVGPMVRRAEFSTGSLEQQPLGCSAEFCNCLLLLPSESQIHRVR